MVRIFVDFEWHPTRQFEENYSEIIQFGAVMMNENYEEIDCFVSYVKPELVKELSWWILDLTKIREEDLQNAPLFSEVFEQFMNWCRKEGNTYEIYSWSDNDSKQLDDNLYMKNIENTESIDYLFDHWTDYQNVFDEYLGFKKSLKLSTALEMTGIQAVGAYHDALSDARNTALLFKYCNDENSREFLDKIRSILNPNDKPKSTLGDSVDFSKLFQ
ncbi:MAG: exonuclease domain-containing protein [Erysipelotrichaceae bacterium]|nr:exonuclease domain-containing protein [Erysipelotrichaceae bacterium]